MLIFPGILAPENVSVIELANITSVQVTWNQPEGGLAVDEYVVSYHRSNGRDGQCSSFQDEGNVTVRTVGDGLTSTTILHLKALYSTYIVNVTSRKGALYNMSSLNFETSSAGMCNACILYLLLFESRRRIACFCRCYSTALVVL